MPKIMSTSNDSEPKDS